MNVNELVEECCGNPKCDGVACKPKRERITRDQATSLVGRHLLVALEDVLAAHELVLKDDGADEVAKANARLVVASAQAIGRPLYVLVKAAERPRILRPERAIRVVR